MPTTHPKSLSTKAVTYSTIAFGAGNCWTNSLMHSPTQMAMTPIATTESIKPLGPLNSSAWALLLKMPPPITPLSAINCRAIVRECLLVLEGEAYEDLVVTERLPEEKLESLSVNNTNPEEQLTSTLDQNSSCFSVVRPDCYYSVTALLL